MQESAKDRPIMSAVISMLNSETVNLPPPRQPALILREDVLNPSAYPRENFSNNSVSITEIEG